MVISIESSYFSAGVVVEEVESGIVIAAAPILKYMIGWGVEEVKRYCEKKGWKYLEI